MEKKGQRFSNLKTLIFVALVCFACALVLSVLASLLKTPQKRARTLYKSKQLLLAARILSYDGYFLLNDQKAAFKKGGILIPQANPPKAKDQEILELFDTRVLTRLTNIQGNLYTFQQANIDQDQYLKENTKGGFSNLPYKLIYVIQDNQNTPTPYGYVIPINGYGLWDAIYGYLGLKTDGETVLGMTFYDQKETPGLGGEIGLPNWQKQFYGKRIFQKTTNLQTAPMGIQVVKTTVKETFGNRPQAKSAVDGIAGASITVMGVNAALKNSLSPYREFLIQANQGKVQING